jgi:deazaflavin-dependent oxidoreductase (nitroreductase family)
MLNTIGNNLMRALIDSPLHRVLGPNMAVIRFSGRKSGRPYAVPINVVPNGDGYDVVSQRARTWWRNLRDGRPAELRVAGQRHAVQAQVLEHPADVQDGLQRFFRRNPGLVRYFAAGKSGGGPLSPAALERLANRHVMIVLRPLPGGPSP